MPTALITGTSTGIGLATAVYLADRGYRVFAGARNPDAVVSHPNVTAIALDVDQDTSVREAVDHILNRVPAIDVLVNNAGIAQSGAMEMVPLDAVRRMFETNFFGAIRMMQAVMPAMRERRNGTIVNVTSIMGHTTFGSHGYYGATKFALAAVSESLAMEAKPLGIKVAIIEPGVILTPIWGKGERLSAEGSPYQRAIERLGRLFRAQRVEGTPPELVAQAIFEAVEEGCVKLRYPVGPDAEVMAAARDRMTAAEWAALMAEEDDEKFIAAAEKAFGVDLYNPPSLFARRSATGG